MSTRRKKPVLRSLTMFMLSMVLLYSFSANADDTSGLQLSCKLDEGIGNVAGDSSGNDHRGSVSGATWTTGKINGGLSFDGIDDYVQIPGLLGQPQNVTISAWANLNAKDTSGAEVFSLGDYVAIRSDGKDGKGIMGFYYDGTTWRNTKTGIMHAGTGWHHFVYVVDDVHNMQKVYIDGIEKGATAYTQSISYTGLGCHTFLGRHGNGVGNYDFNGVIDDVRLYNRALSAQEVQDVYALGEAVNKAPIVHAGEDLVIIFPNTAHLHGSIMDDGLPEESALTCTWSKDSGPGIVTFEDPHKAVTTASFSEPGVYELCLSASDSEFSKHDHLTITVNQAATPTPTHLPSPTPTVTPVPTPIPTPTLVVTHTPIPTPIIVASPTPIVVVTTTPVLIPTPTPGTHLSSLEIFPATLTLTAQGETHQLSVTGVYSDGSRKNLTSFAEGTSYTTLAANIADVTFEGLVTSNNNGTTTVTVKNNGVSGQLPIIVAIQTQEPYNPTAYIGEAEGHILTGCPRMYLHGWHYAIY